MERIVILGPPGAGKGTQALLLCERLSLPHISTGEILRSAVSNETKLGLEAKKYMDGGELVPDEVVIGLVRERLSESDCDNGYLLDGFPRTIEQAKELDVILKEIGKELTVVLELQVPEQALLDRIKNRAAEGSGRSDDTLEVASNRLRVYWEQTAPVTAYYEQCLTVEKIDGMGTVDEVTDRITDIFNNRAS
ncbi:MAG: adenylate kinase [Bdellovibrionales bacterium]|nr:adenylate kinase [Bdellovibrionales bacterium]